MPSICQPALHRHRAARSLMAIALGILPACARGAHSGPVALPTDRTSRSAPTSPPVGEQPAAGDATSTQPVVVIVMENHEYSSVVGSSGAGYINRRLIGHGKLFTSYDAVSHPSLPNYLAMTSGSTDGKQGTDSITAGEISRNNLFHQLARAGIRWRVYEESLPSACDRAVVAGTSPGFYALKHDPAMAYADIANTRLCRRVVPFSRLDPTRLRKFSFVTPNECSDMHSCSISTGDRWLR